MFRQENQSKKQRKENAPQNTKSIEGELAHILIAYGAGLATGALIVFYLAFMHFGR